MFGGPWEGRNEDARRRRVQSSCDHDLEDMEVEEDVEYENDSGGTSRYTTTRTVQVCRKCGYRSDGY